MINSSTQEANNRNPGNLETYKAQLNFIRDNKIIFMKKKFEKKEHKEALRQL